MKMKSNNKASSIQKTPQAITISNHQGAEQNKSHKTLNNQDNILVPFSILFLLPSENGIAVVQAAVIDKVVAEEFGKVGRFHFGLGLGRSNATAII